MLVDDDAELAELLASQLTRAGFEVRFADSLANAQQVASEEKPFDVLITDLHLPDGDGAAVATALGVPIKLALTGSSNSDDAKRLMADGFSAVLVKPLSAKQVVEAVTRSLEAKKVS